MKFSLKILLWTIIVMALALGFSGFYFVNYVFETSLEREVGQEILRRHPAYFPDKGSCSSH